MPGFRRILTLSDQFWGAGQQDRLTKATVNELIEGLSQENHGLAVEIASIPERIRGFGHVKARHLRDAKARETTLMAVFRNPEPAQTAAE